MNDVIIVGGGPAGYSAAIYLARAGLSPLVIEGTTGGGQLALTTEVENYPGFPDGIMGPELVMNFRKQAERFDTRFVTENVTQINPKSEIRNPNQILNFNVQTGNNKEYEAKSVLIATGADAMWLNLPSEQKLRGKGVSACATCDGFFFRNKIVAVVGGGDTALEEALTLTKFATKVYLIHRRDEFRASKIMVERALNNSKIEVIYNAQVIEVIGEDKVEGLKLQLNPKSEIRNPKQARNTKEENSKRLADSNLFRTSNFELRILPVNGLFIAIGHKPATGFLDGSGVLLDRKGYIVTSGSSSLSNAQFLINLISKKNQNPNDNLGIRNFLDQLEQLEVRNYNYDYQYATSVPGIFAAGDCVDHVYRQAGTAVGMGIAAALEIQNFLEQ